MNDELKRAVEEVKNRISMSSFSETRIPNCLIQQLLSEVQRCEEVEFLLENANEANCLLQSKLAQCERELEQAKEDRNRAGVEERRKYLLALDSSVRSFESFRGIESYREEMFKQDAPECFNGIVRIYKYRITCERIEEPVEVLQSGRGLL